MKIANIDLGERPVMLAPMEDVTDASFRLICREQGAAMVYTEFVSAEALIRNVSSTTRKLHIDDSERPVAIQIYGREADAMVEAARIVEEAQPDLIDINFGCPVKKVASKGAGAGMLRDIPKMLDITRRVVQAVNIPVTVKTRLGWDADNKIITELGPMLQDCGIAALTIHGRTRAQMYTGSADWSLIGELKNDPRMHIPVIGNGDITTPEQARDAFERFGVDGIMIGRAAFGAPWIFRDVRDLLDNTGREPLSVADKFALLRRQVTESVQRIDEYRGILHIRRHLAASPLFKGLPNFRETRIRLLRTETMEEIFNIFDEINRRFFQLSDPSDVL
ncbi:MAG: tRNA dihydrouridine synthase DusB [Muribaculaceae bacterium]|nr:tRNA dihydrouridine synthase DusB [Muribaculaceae bacterium]